MRTTAGAGWLNYSQSGAGKTAAPAALFDGRGTVIEFQPDAHRVMSAVYDCTPKKVHHCQLLEDALKIAKSLKPSDGPILLDDIHYMITSYGKRGTEFWNRMEDALFGIAEVTANLSTKGVQVFVTSLEQGPGTTSRGPQPGGPLLPGQMSQQFAGLFHVVTRMVPYGTEDIPGHRYWLDFGSDPLYVGRSRDLATTVKQYPPFIPEILRFTGVSVTLPVVEKYDKAVEILAAHVLEECEDLEATKDKCNELLRHLIFKQKLTPGKARQVVMAGLTRGMLRYSQGII